MRPNCAQSGAANLGRSRLLGGQSRLKAGCGQNCPPYTGVPSNSPAARSTRRTFFGAAEMKLDVLPLPVPGEYRFA